MCRSVCGVSVVLPAARTLISVIFSHVHRRWRMVVFSTIAHRSAIRADRASSIHIASSEPFCIVHRDPHRSILGRAWRAHALRGRCAGVRGSCLALSLESGYEDRVQIQIYDP